MVTFTSSEYQIDKLNVAYMLINWQKKMLHLINITSQLLVSGNKKISHLIAVLIVARVCNKDIFEKRKKK